MIANAYIAARVTADTKRRFDQLAQDQGLTESAFLKRLIDGSIAASGGLPRQESDAVDSITPNGRLSIRLRSIS